MPNEEKHLQKRWLELIVASLFGLVGGVVMVDSLRVGKGWSEDGPQAGYFPFYIACLLLGGAVVVIAQTLRDWQRDGGNGVFTGRAEWRLMLTMLLPMVVYVGFVMWLGIYVASTLFIAVFMRWQGKYSWIKSMAVGAGVSVALFVLFEIWFLVPLPKGPLEAMLGY